MRGYWFVAALAASGATGCAEWPRSANLGEDPEYVDADALVTAPVTYQDPASVETLEDWADLPTGATQETIRGFGLARLLHGTLDGGGWSNDDVEPGCGPFEGFYEGDSDGILRFTIAQESYLCVRGQLDTTENVGWDLSLINIENEACGGPVVDADDKPLGGGVTRPDVVWGTNVQPGEYAVLIGAYSPSTADFNVAYTAGISVWAPFNGSAQQCPLLEAAE